MNPSSFAWEVSTWVIPALLAITLHEAAHGYAARALGDPTAERLGRITMNPLRHIDPFGTILLPGLLILMKSGFLFGYAKPVPVNFSNLKDPKRDMVLVAAAGPGMNLLLALIAAILYHGVDALPEPSQAWIADNLENALRFNVLLAVFNMLPIPPLDGASIVGDFSPRFDRLRYQPEAQPWFLAALFGAVILLPIGQLAMDLALGYVRLFR